MNKILEKIKKFIYKYFIQTEIPMLKESEEPEEIEDIQKIEEIIQSENKNNKFRDYLDVKEYQEILTLQDRYENQEITEEELSIVQVMNLIDLYKSQIRELKSEIDLKEKKLDAMNNE